MEEEADITVNKAEMRIGMQDIPTRCMSISSDMLAPTHCYSKTGNNTASMFGGHHSASSAGRGRTGARGPADYAALFDQYYGSDAIMDRMVVAQQQGGGGRGGRHVQVRGANGSSSARGKGRPMSASAADRSSALRSADAATGSSGTAEARQQASDQRLDKDIAHRAGRETHAKYLTSYLATKYAVDVEGLSHRPPVNPALQGLRMVPAGALPKEVALAAGDKQGAAKVLELAGMLEEGERQRTARAAADRQRNARALALRAVRPQSATASFKTTTRDQAQMASIREGTSGSSGTLGPGMYEASRYHMYAQRHVSSPSLRPPPGSRGGGGGDMVASGREAVEGGIGEEEYDLDGEAESPAATMAIPQGHHQSRKQQRKQPVPPSPAILAMFRDAHSVHPKKQPPHGGGGSGSRGTSAFRTRPRETVDVASTASHLFLKYFHEDYDAILKKSPKLLSPFELQVRHPPVGTPADTPDTIGPGSYLNRGFMPDRLTGSHVAAGHGSHLRHALDFTRQAPRPGSAPPASLRRSGSSRPYSAATGTGCRPPGGYVPVGAGEGAAAMAKMYGPSGADISPTELYFGVQALQALAGVDRVRGRRVQSAAAVAGVRPAGGRGGDGCDDDDGCVGVIQEEEEEEWYGGADGGAVAAAGVGGPASARLSYIGPEEVQRFSSAGFSKRVPGGKMSMNSRAAETMGLRAMSKDGVIPPSSGPLRLGAGADVVYAPDDSVQAHRTRSPAWQLPPNRNARSKAWVSSAALAYL